MRQKEVAERVDRICRSEDTGKLSVVKQFSDD